MKFNHLISFSQHSLITSKNRFTLNSCLTSWISYKKLLVFQKAKHTALYQLNPWAREKKNTKFCLRQNCTIKQYIYHKTRLSSVVAVHLCNSFAEITEGVNWFKNMHKGIYRAFACKYKCYFRIGISGSAFTTELSFLGRAVTKALIGGGGVNIHIFAFCPTNFFWNQLSLELISKEIRRAEREYMNMHPPPQLTL